MYDLGQFHLYDDDESLLPAVLGGYARVTPLPADHAEAIAEMSLEMLRITSEFGTQINEALTVRIGISTGPVVVGDMVLVINDRGQISAFRVKPLPGAAAGKKTVPETPAPTAEESK